MAKQYFQFVATTFRFLHQMTLILIAYNLTSNVLWKNRRCSCNFDSFSKSFNPKHV